MSDLAEQLLETLGRIRRHTRRQIQRPAPLAQLSAAEAELVRLVRRNPGISVAAAAGELGVAPNTVSTLVGSLVAAGMLQRAPDPNDRRVARLELTADARTRVERWRDERIAVVAAAVGALSDTDRGAIADALPALARLGDQLRPEDT